MEFLSNVKKHEVKSQVKGDDIIDPTHSPGIAPIALTFTGSVAMA